jgi:hypothetical protein
MTVYFHYVEKHDWRAKHFFGSFLLGKRTLLTFIIRGIWAGTNVCSVAPAQMEKV